MENKNRKEIDHSELLESKRKKKERSKNREKGQFRTYSSVESVIQICTDLCEPLFVPEENRPGTYRRTVRRGCPSRRECHP